jgi:hypothetical protein
LHNINVDIKKHQNVDLKKSGFLVLIAQYLGLKKKSKNNSQTKKVVVGPTNLKFIVFESMNQTCSHIFYS